MGENVKLKIGCGSSTMGVLAIMLIILKLAGVIDWSWWIVLIPIWLPLALFAVVISIVGSVALAILLITMFAARGNKPNVSVKRRR
jgi:phosphoglycerol transferase MdoB-like AlkP superfamily enzyme